MKKISLLLLLLLLAACSFTGVSAEPRKFKQPDRPEIEGLVVSPDDKLPKLTAKSACLIEATTGQVLYERDSEAKRYPASTTKAMTLIVALEEGNLTDMVKVSSHAAGTEGSTLWLEEGEKIPLEDLLYGMMMISGNDATVAVAEHIAGSVPAFARLMTQKAREIGVTQTQFVNSSGLPDKQHYTTAHDLALIAAYGYKNPRFTEITSTKEKIFPWVHDDSHKLRNENQLLWLYEGANGVKTGYTDDAGRCLIAGAKRGGIQLVAVVLDSAYIWNDTIAMFDYGFEHLRTKQVVRRDETVRQVPVTSGNARSLNAVATQEAVVPVIDDGAAENFTRVVDMPDTLKATVHKGDTIGTLRIMKDGREVATIPLVADRTVERKSFFLTVLSKLQDFVRSISPRRMNTYADGSEK